MRYGQKLDGSKIRDLRRMLNLSQAELGKKTGSTQATISALEQGTRPARYKTTRQLAKALGVEPRELLLREEESSN